MIEDRYLQHLLKEGLVIENGDRLKVTGKGRKLLNDEEVKKLLEADSDED